MISSIYSVDFLSAVVRGATSKGGLDPKLFVWIAASVADAVPVNPNGTKTLLANIINTFFINIKPAVINGLRKLRNPPSWLVIFLVVPFNKIRSAF